TNRHLPASRLSFAHQRRKHIGEFKTFFGGEVTFGAAVDELVFASSIRRMPIVGADPYLNNLLVQYCEEAISARATKPSSFGLSVENALALLLPHGNARVDAVARKLGLSRRTLTRHLSSEGLTFARLLQRLKSELAKRHLADATLS